MMKKELTSRDLDVLAALNDQKWQAPRNVSRGTLTSRELYATLRKLVRRGLVQAKYRRRHFTRASYYYRLTKQGALTKLKDFLTLDVPRETYDPSPIHIQAVTASLPVTPELADDYRVISDSAETIINEALTYSLEVDSVKITIEGN